MKDKITIPTQSGVISLDPQSIKEAQDWEEFVSLWTVSQEIDHKNQWYKGDIADRVAIVHGEQSLKRFAEEVNEPATTIINYRRVARAFPDEEMRNWNLSWTHYLIASLTDSYNKGQQQFDSEERFKWLEDAHDNRWSTTRLQEEIKKHGALKDEKDYFQYYSDYLDKVKNILTHIERDKLQESEKDALIKKVSDIYTDVMLYLKDEKR